MRTQRTIYIIGVFDLFHRGHLELLRRGKALGDRLIVAINSDDIVARYKRAPIFCEDDRLALVKACEYVDEAFIIRKFDNSELLKKFEVDFVVHGDDWDENSYKEQIGVTNEFLHQNNVRLKFLPYTAHISTSGLIEKIKGIQ